MIRNVDLAVYSGEFVAIAGSYGSGKSTALRMSTGIGEANDPSDKVFVMGERPGRILGAISIDVPRPRNRKGETFMAPGREIMSLPGLEE